VNCGRTQGSLAEPPFSAGVRDCDPDQMAFRATDGLLALMSLKTIQSYPAANARVWMASATWYSVMGTSVARPRRTWRKSLPLRTLDPANQISTRETGCTIASSRTVRTFRRADLRLPQPPSAISSLSPSRLICSTESFASSITRKAPAILKASSARSRAPSSESSDTL
jgi:hypothetical protein